MFQIGDRVKKVHGRFNIGFTGVITATVLSSPQNFSEDEIFDGYDAEIVFDGASFDEDGNVYPPGDEGCIKSREWELYKEYENGP